MDWKTKTMLFYGIGGLLLGVLAGIASINNAEEKDQQLEISLQEGARLGVNALNSLSKVIIK